LGIALGEQGNFSEAVQSFKRALQLKPDYTEAYTNLEVTLARQEKVP
jgi:Flp pilus assembly protein TadD